MINLWKSHHAPATKSARASYEIRKEASTDPEGKILMSLGAHHHPVYPGSGRRRSHILPAALPALWGVLVLPPERPVENPNLTRLPIPFCARESIREAGAIRACSGSCGGLPGCALFSLYVSAGSEKLFIPAGIPEAAAPDFCVMRSTCGRRAGLRSRRTIGIARRFFRSQKKDRKRKNVSPRFRRAEEITSCG